MPDQRDRIGVEFEAGDARERELWAALGQIERADPPTRLRSAFYARLDALSAAGPGWWPALRRWFGHPLLPAAAMLLIGVLVGRALERPAANRDVQALRQEVAVLQRNVALSLMHSRSAAERLRGVISAAELVAVDPELTRALLRQAGDDPNRSVRVAAIDALGTRVRAPDVGGEVLRLLGDSASPLVQKALVDLILRHGDADQLNGLVERARDGALHPDLVAYVQAAVRRNGA